MKRIVVCMMVLAPVLWAIGATAEAGRKSDSKVKASAAASKIDGNGKQELTVTLEIERSWYLYARPVNFRIGGIAEDEEERFKIAVSAKEKITAAIKYPPGKTFKSESVQCDFYEGRVVVKAVVQRTKGDVSPLNLAIYVDASDRRMFCILPGVIRLTVPQE